MCHIIDIRWFRSHKCGYMHTDGSHSVFVKLWMLLVCSWIKE